MQPVASTAPLPMPAQITAFTMTQRHVMTRMQRSLPGAGLLNFFATIWSELVLAAVLNVGGL